MPLGDTLKRKKAQGLDLSRATVRCPAGRAFEDVLKGRGCFCRIEESKITEVEHPSSLASFCMGNYTACPSWRADKEHHWAQKRLIDFNFPKRSGNTLLDQDPETVPAFMVPPG